jgi:negative regulator of sigma E activity
VYVRPLGDALVTAVGEVPPATLRAVAQSVAARAPR